ncbi:MAG TPA: cobyric acid synthase CobQ, partial [Lachnospiraceae bacterium]|nr:cobyric acid synthase CobQ [Lachnospiraceae bacterium]
PDEEKIIAAVILLPHISNYTDFSLLAAYEGVSLSYIKNVRELGRPDLVILPGSKNTMGDLLWLRQSGLEASIQRLAKEGKRIIGICGGYQMLGKTIRDPDCMEHGGLLRGIGLLPAATCFGNKKHRTRVTGKIEKQETCYQTLSHVEFEGYEIHMGDTVLEEGATARSFAVLKDSVNNTCYNDGYVKDNILGTYVHGILDSPQLLKALLTPLFEEKGLQMEAVEYEDHYRYKLRQYDLLADVIREHMDMKAVYEMLGL